MNIFKFKHPPYLQNNINIQKLSLMIPPTTPKLKRKRKKLKKKKKNKYFKKYRLKHFYLMPIYNRILRKNIVLTLKNTSKKLFQRKFSKSYFLKNKKGGKRKNKLNSNKINRLKKSAKKRIKKKKYAKSYTKFHHYHTGFQKSIFSHNFF